MSSDHSQILKLVNQIVGATTHNIIGIVGNPGTGKTLLLTRVLCWELEQGRTVFATYHINYTAKSGAQPHYVDFGKLLSLLQAREQKFRLGSAVLALDEAYLGLDSREWKSRANIYLTKCLQQCRKLGLDIYFAGPLFSRIDKSLRGMTGVLIVCDKEFVKYKKDPHKTVPQFHYYMQNRLTGEITEFAIDYDMFLETIKWYDTQEIAKETEIRVDKEDDRALFDALAEGFEGSDEANMIPQKDKGKANS